MKSMTRILALGLWLVASLAGAEETPEAMANTSPDSSSSAETTTPAEAPEGPRPMTVEDLWAVERVGSPQVSPDGQWVVFTVSSYSMEDNKSNTDLWLVASDGRGEPRRLTWQKGTDGSPAWSPDGKSLLFVSKRDEDKPPQLHRLRLDGGEAEPLTELPIGVSKPTWFPDGKRVLFQASTYPDLNDQFEKVGERVQEQKDDETQAKVTETRLLRYWDSYRTSGQVPHLFVLDLETREVKDLMPGYDRLNGFGDFSWDLAPDGAEIAFSANSTDPPYQELNFDIYLLTVADGSIRKLTDENPASDGSPKYTPDGRYLLFGRTSRPNIAPDFTRLARYDRKSGEIRGLAEDWDHEPSGWQLTEDGQTIVFHAQNRGRFSLYSLSIDGGTPHLLVRGGRTGSVRVAAGDRLVFLEESFTAPPELMTITLGEPETKTALTALNAKRMADLEFGEIEDVTFAGADGQDVQMFVLHPPGFDPAKKWPLLMLVHGGPHGAWMDSFHFRWNAAMFAAPGYVVAGLNFHGSTGFGQAFAESIVGNHADKPFADVMRATDTLLERPYIDPDRLTAAGGSYGGYLVSWILGHTDRFAALVNHAGVYDLMAQFASDYTWSRSNNYGAEPWTDPDRIDLYSPSRYAKNFKTPTLILHGELDYRVPYTQGVNLHGVLTGKGVPSRIVIFPKENHWILKPQAARLWWKEVFDWLERFAGAGGRP